MPKVFPSTSPITDAVDLHSRNPAAFDSRYQTSPDFRERFDVWAKLILKYSAPTSTVADVGCGSGIFSLFAARHNRLVAAIDGSAEMLELCRTKSAQAQLCNLTFHRLRIERLATADLEPVDLLLCSSVLEYLDDLPAALMALRSLIRPQGVAIFSLPNARSFYRKAERLSYTLIRRPAYFAFVRHVLTPEKFNQMAANEGFHRIEAHYYANFLGLFRRGSFLIPPARVNNLFVAVYTRD